MSESRTTDRPRLVVGTAGHIDHGKSRLVLALTGVDPDRLPEEKSRGMTIELGFAHTAIGDCDVWFVDVPGHERFIRNMVAGATGVDAALLVVAADDSVMPQTREHAEVLALLGVKRCIVALTKMDLVDDEWAGAVEDEVGELLDSLRIAPLKFVRTSAETRRGLDELAGVLAVLAQNRASESDGYAWFRMPIDRAFTIAGRGTVVTGSVLHGSVQTDDELELWPAGRKVRARDLQSHFEGQAAGAAHMRLAVNLAGVSLDDVQRGCELATPGYLEPTRILDARVFRLRMPGKTRKKRLRLRLHIATRETLVEVLLPESPAAHEIRDAFAQLTVAEAIVASHGQRFILRDESGTRTLGGGEVLRPAARRWSAKRPAHAAGLTALTDADEKLRLDEVFRDIEWRRATAHALATRAGLADVDRVGPLLQRLGGEGRVRSVVEASVDGCFHRDVLNTLAETLGQRLEAQLAANPRWPGVTQREWPNWMPRACPARLRPAVAQWLIDSGDVCLVNGFVLPAGSSVTMSPADAELYAAILAEFHVGAFQPPTVKTLACRTQSNGRRVDELIELAAARGDLRRIGGDIRLHADRWDELVRRVCSAIRERGPLTVAEIRTLLDSSRKFVVPIVEALDAAGVTKRAGDRRELGASAV